LDEAMKKTLRIVKADNGSGTDARQGPFERLKVNPTSTTVDATDRDHGQRPLVTVNSSSNSFSIDRILQPVPPLTGPPWSTSVNVQNYNEATWTAPTQHGHHHHHHPSAWSSSWPPYYVSTTAQQFGYSTANSHDTGEFNQSLGVF